ncbi:hypothetical protein ACJZ2D_008432 [Fusarium nematophilum]
MKPSFAVLLVSLLGSAAASAIEGPRHIKRIESEPLSDEHELFKRRGGGGGGGRGGGGGGGGSGGGRSGGSSGGSSGGGRSGSGRSGGSRGSSRSGSGSTSNRGGSSPNSNAGGGSRGGSGPQPNFAGGRFYPGGATAPYKAGGRSPVAGILPFVLVGSALAFWPGVWLYGAYMYDYPNRYHYYNETSEEDEVRDVLCGCSQYEVCACDDNNNTDYYSELIGNGSWDALNKSIVNVAEVNGTMTILINGTLPNGTTVPEEDSPAGASMRSLVENLGYWPAVAAVMAAVFLA